ncbi:MAG: hypothetical protein QOG15_3684 [Solirubrobacteraceae bacterium]|jgi:uncharacterized membrane protein HdeD (DUF308 family)|nr:hypothetical protein [Solirubrobacteraceae bacterium]
MGLTGRLGNTATPPAEGMRAWIVGLQLSSDDVRKARIWLIVTGVLALLTGMAAIIVPAVASVATAIFIGWMLIIAGAIMGMHAWSQRATGQVGWRMLNAAVTVIAGALIVVLPLTGTITLTLLLVAWFWVSAGAMLAAAWRSRGMPGNGWLAFNGIASLLLGFLIIIDFPSSAGWAIGLLVGINLVFWGVRALVAAWALTRAVPA